MKKQLLTFIAIAFSTLALAQTKDYSGIIGSKTEFITETKSTKNSLWMNAQAWVNSVSTEYFKKVDSEDKEAGTILLKLESYLPTGINGKTEYSKVKVLMNVKIDCRDKKYRTIFSNFTAGVEPDRNVNTQYLSPTQLNNMTIELQRIVDLSNNNFKKETVWSIDDMLVAKDRYINLNKEHQAIIDQQDKSSKQGQKTIKLRTNYIAIINDRIDFIDFITKGFGKKIEEVNSSLNKSMSVTDNF